MAKLVMPLPQSRIRDKVVTACTLVLCQLSLLLQLSPLAGKWYLPWWDPLTSQLSQSWEGHGRSWLQGYSHVGTEIQYVFLNQFMFCLLHSLGIISRDFKWLFKNDFQQLWLFTMKRDLRAPEPHSGGPSTFTSNITDFLQKVPLNSWLHSFSCGQIGNGWEDGSVGLHMGNSYPRCRASCRKHMAQGIKSQQTCSLNKKPMECI